MLKVKRLDTLYDPERAFVNLYGDSDTAFWLDSSKIDERARFSFMGARRGPAWSGRSPMTSRAASCASSVHPARRCVPESIFDYLSREMRHMRYLSHDLPFDFNCGFVGYFGYELKADCEGNDAHHSTMPDAAFVFADRLIAFDHVEQCTYVLCVAEPGDAEQGDRWIAETSLRLGFAAADQRSGVGRHVRARASGLSPQPLPPAVPR